MFRVLSKTTIKQHLQARMLQAAAKWQTDPVMSLSCMVTPVGQRTPSNSAEPPVNLFILKSSMLSLKFSILHCEGHGCGPHSTEAPITLSLRRSFPWNKNGFHASGSDCFDTLLKKLAMPIDDTFSSPAIRIDIGCMRL